MPDASAVQWLADVERAGAATGALLQRLRAEVAASRGVDPALPGRVYEGMLAQDRRLRRSQGSFYTPDYIVDFVVSQTLRPLAQRLHWWEIRVVDPACGGGFFLLGALDFLEELAASEGQSKGPALRKRIAERCLAGIDVDARALQMTRLALELAVGQTGLALDLRCVDALLEGDARTPCSAIVGNPPWGQKGIRVAASRRREYARRYRTCKGAFDPFKLFVERCHQMLDAGGRWGLVLPDILLLKDHQIARDVILEGSALDCIAHAGRVFSGVNLDAVVLVGERRERPSGRNEVAIWHSLAEEWRERPRPDHTCAQSVFREFPGHKFNLYLHGGDLQLWRRLRDYPRLGEVFEMHEGVHSGNCRAKLFVERATHEACHPLIVGRGEVARYRLDWHGRFLDTRPQVVDRGAGDYASLGRPEWHLRPKIVVRRTGDHVVAAWDARGLYVSNNLFVLLPLESSRVREEELLAYTALLNSALMTWYFRAEQPRRGRLFAELKLVHLRDFPRPRVQLWTQAVPRLAGLARQLSSAQSPARAQELAAAVNEVVEKAFDLSPKERRLFTIGK